MARKARKEKKPARPKNSSVLTVKLSPTVTGGLEVGFTTTSVKKDGGRKTRTAVSAADTFATVTGALEAVSLRIADFVEEIKKNDPMIGDLFVMESTSKKKKKE